MGGTGIKRRDWKKGGRKWEGAGGNGRIPLIFEQRCTLLGSDDCHCDGMGRVRGQFPKAGRLSADIRRRGCAIVVCVAVNQRSHISVKTTRPLSDGIR